MSRKDTQPKSPDQTGDGFRFRFPNWPAWIVFASIAAVGAALDLWSKKAVFDWLGPAGSENAYTVIPGFFQFVCRLNNGAAFSIMRGQRMFLAGISIIALLIMLLVFSMGLIRRRISLIASGCMTAGIIGNLYDRAFNEGMVRDFLDFHIGSYAWPTFNVADSLLCIGVGLILLANFTSEADQKPDLPQKEGY